MLDFFVSPLPIVVFAVLFGLVPLWDHLAMLLAKRLNEEWAEGSVYWAEEAGVSDASLTTLRETPPVTVPEPHRLSVWVFGGVISLLSAIWVWQNPADLIGLSVTAALGATLLVAVLVDLRVQLLPDVLIWPLAALGATVSVLGWGLEPRTALLGALSGGMALWSLSMMFQLMRGRTGLGLGDVKLVSMAGLWVGWMPLPWLLLSASIVAIVLYVLSGPTSTERRIPFGPALACAFVAIRLLPI